MDQICQGIGGCLQFIYNLGVQIAVALAFIMIIVGGFEYMFSGAIAGKLRGKDRIKDAVTGLVIIFISGSVLYYINPNIFKATIPLPQIKIQIAEEQSQPTQTPPTTQTCGDKQCINIKDQNCAGNSVSAGKLSLKNPDLKVHPDVCGTIITLVNNANSKGVLPEITAARTMEGWDVGKHTNDCHNIRGTCIDVVPKNRGDVNQWKNLILALYDTTRPIGRGTFYVEGDCASPPYNQMTTTTIETCRQEGMRGNAYIPQSNGLQCCVEVGGRYFGVYKFTTDPSAHIHYTIR